MKVALIVHRVQSKKENIQNIKDYIVKASNYDTDLILFSEASITGLINNDQKEHDLKLGNELSDEEITTMSEYAKRYQMYIGIGIFEREGETLYDSALLFNKKGELVLKYRRITPTWHGYNVDKTVYKEGETVTYCETEFGKMCFLICGDLFSDALVNKVKALNVDYLLFPLARALLTKENMDAEWNKEMHLYLNQINKSNAKTLMTNYVDSEYIGGAYIVEDGIIKANLRLDYEGILFYEF